MDKSWIHIRNRFDSDYLNGVNHFLEFAYADKTHDSKIYCPCQQCGNRRYETKGNVLAHLIEYGFLTQYMTWTMHGEFYSDGDGTQDSNSKDDMFGMVHDAFGTHRLDREFTANRDESTSSGQDAETKKFFKLLEDAQRELYPGCDSFTSLSFVVQLMHIKVLNGWSDKSFDMLVALLKKAFLKGETIPKSYYDAKKFNEALGFSYKKIDACPRDCMLYWKDKEKLDKCDYCHMSRYKLRKANSDDETPIITNIPAKQVWYFPLTPRLQKLFMSSKTASLMRWHAEKRTDDGKIRHPADSLAWKDFDEKHQDFASDCRNVRLGLASDGFSPFKSLTNPHSTWPDALLARLRSVPEDDRTPEFREQVFTEILGCDGHGRVRTWGSGPCPTEVFGKKNDTSREKHASDMENKREEIRGEVREVVREEVREELREELHEVVRNDVREELQGVIREEIYKELREEFNDKFKQIERQCAELEVQVRVGGNRVPNSLIRKSPVRKSLPVQDVSDAQSFHDQSEDPTDLLKVGMVVRLFNVARPKKVVDEAIIISKDPHKELDGMQLGDGFWVVKINKTILPQQPLLIPRGNIRTVEQAIKKQVFWRTIDIKKNEVIEAYLRPSEANLCVH